MTARVNTALLANLFFPLKRSSESVSLSAILRELELRNRKKIQPINFDFDQLCRMRQKFVELVAYISRVTRNI